MADLELGNMMFNTNVNQNFNCSDWIVALLRDLDRTLCRVMWNINQEEYDSPFANTANTFKNDVFEVQAYNWNDEVEQPYNFKCGDIEISWYKYLGRDTTINNEFDNAYIIEMFNKCKLSLLEYEEIEMKKKYGIQ